MLSTRISVKRIVSGELTDCNFITDSRVRSLTIVGQYRILLFAVLSITSSAKFVKMQPLHKVTRSYPYARTTIKIF